MVQQASVVGLLTKCLVTDHQVCLTLLQREVEGTGCQLERCM